MTGHRVRVSPFGPVRRLWCYCGWSVSVGERGAALAAEAHLFSVAPDAAVEQGRDGGGPWWAPEAVS